MKVSTREVVLTYRTLSVTFAFDCSGPCRSAPGASSTDHDFAARNNILTFSKCLVTPIPTF
jgi:hypothetical protein